MAIAGPSFLKLFLTFLIHEQNLLAKDLRFFISIIAPKFFFATEQMEINRLTHTRDDNCGIEQYYTQSRGPGQYYTTNLVPKAEGVNPLAIDNVTIYPREGYGFNNKQIDADSVLRNQPEFKNNRCLIRPQARPFTGVPYMGGGRGNPDVESLLLHSEQVRQGKECGTVTEQMFDGVFTPLIPVLKENIQKATNLITEEAAPGWIRGGLPSRSYIRDVNC